MRPSPAPVNLPLPSLKPLPITLFPIFPFSLAVLVLLLATPTDQLRFPSCSAIVSGFAPTSERTMLWGGARLQRDVQRQSIGSVGHVDRVGIVLQKHLRGLFPPLLALGRDLRKPVCNLRLKTQNCHNIHRIGISHCVSTSPKCWQHKNRSGPGNPKKCRHYASQSQDTNNCMS